MRSALISIFAATAITFAGIAGAAAAPISGLGDAASATDILIQIKKGGGNKGGGNWKGGGKWKGGGGNWHGGSRHGWVRGFRGRACPYGFALTCIPGGCWCVPW